MPLVNNVITKFSDPAGLAFPENVMGQEDLYREAPPGVRVQRGGTARIVFSGLVPVARYEIVYSSNDLTLNRTTGIVSLSTPTRFPEVFLTPVSVDSLYAFRVRVWKPDLSEFEESGTYYFHTGSTVSLDVPSPETAVVFVPFEPTLVEVEQTGPDAVVSHQTPPPPDTFSVGFVLSKPSTTVLAQLLGSGVTDADTFQTIARLTT